MPLSDNEQRLLEQMERALYAEDPKFASAMRGGSRRTGALPRLLIGLVAVVLGLLVLVLGVAQGSIWLGIVGFVVMLAGVVFALSTQRKSPLGVVGPTGSVHPAGRRRKGSFIKRMEERWDRRQDER